MEYILSEFDREHIEGWKRMKEEIKRLNWNEVPLVTADDFTSSLIFLPPAKPENSKRECLLYARAVVLPLNHSMKQNR